MASYSDNSSYAEQLEPGIYGETDPGRLNAIINSLASGYATGQLGATIPSLTKGAYGVLKGLGNAGKMALGGTPEGVAGAKAVSKGLKALTVPEETVNALSILGKGPNAADLVAELKVGLQTAKPKDVITLSNGTKWRFDGIQKIGNKSETLLEHIEGPVPEGVRQGISTTLTTLENSSIPVTTASRLTELVDSINKGSKVPLEKGSLTYVGKMGTDEKPLHLFNTFGIEGFKDGSTIGIDTLKKAGVLK